MTRDDLSWWSQAVAGKRMPVHEYPPECGYFKVRDRSGANRDLAPIKRPWVACAIWSVDGEYKAELDGKVTSYERIWPYCAKYPIPYEHYTFWHEHGRFPEE